MIALNHFNQLSGEQAVAVLEPCVAVSGWSMNTIWMSIITID